MKLVTKDRLVPVKTNEDNFSWGDVEARACTPLTTNEDVVVERIEPYRSQLVPNWLTMENY